MDEAMLVAVGTVARVEAVEVDEMAVTMDEALLIVVFQCLPRIVLIQNLATSWVFLKCGYTSFACSSQY